MRRHRKGTRRIAAHESSPYDPFRHRRKAAGIPDLTVVLFRRTIRSIAQGRKPKTSRKHGNGSMPGCDSYYSESGVERLSIASSSRTAFQSFCLSSRRIPIVSRRTVRSRNSCA